MKHALAFALVLAAVCGAPRTVLAEELSVLQYGAWGLSLHPDPFKHKYPVVSYLFL